jgi:1,4-dihydroxy-6-naphthoate synthase
MKLTIGFSPCPNDTFIFDALINKKIDSGGLEFEAVLEDVETLNGWALAGKLDITKLSFPAFFQSLNNYILLNSGSALGKGVGPLLITAKKETVSADEVKDHLIALPGVNTTAHLLFGFAYPDAVQKQFMRFDTIEDFVLSGTATASPADTLGVIIHENRFTYQQRGLQKITDLGEYWEKKMNVPIPLGGIAIKRGIDREISVAVDQLIRKSLAYAFEHYPFITDYVKQHSQAMQEDVMRQHIDLYVNNYSLDLGEDGKKAIEVLQEVYRRNRSQQESAQLPLFL